MSKLPLILLLLCIAATGCRKDFSRYYVVEGVTQSHIDEEVWPSHIDTIQDSSSKHDDAFVLIGSVRHRGNGATDGTIIHGTWLTLPVKGITESSTYNVYEYRVWDGHDKCVLSYNTAPSSHRLDSPIKVIVHEKSKMRNGGHHHWTISVDAPGNTDFQFLQGKHTFTFLESD